MDELGSKWKEGGILSAPPKLPLRPLLKFCIIAADWYLQIQLAFSWEAPAHPPPYSVSKGGTPWPPGGHAKRHWCPQESGLPSVQISKKLGSRNRVNLVRTRACSVSTTEKV